MDQGRDDKAFHQHIKHVAPSVLTKGQEGKIRR